MGGATMTYWYVWVAAYAGFWAVAFTLSQLPRKPY